VKPRKAWRDKESARRHVANVWGERELRIAGSALQAARDVCEEIPALLEGARRKFADYYRLRDRIADMRKPMESIAKIAKTAPEWDAMPGTLDVVARLVTAYDELAGHLVLASTERKPGTLRRENLRAKMLSFVYRAAPQFKATATEWAYFGIASGMDAAPASSDEFRDEAKPMWTDALRRAKAAAAAKPLPEGSRLTLLRDLAGDDEDDPTPETVTIQFTKRPGKSAG
jgi:hypothetical protein